MSRALDRDLMAEEVTLNIDGQRDEALAQAYEDAIVEWNKRA